MFLNIFFLFFKFVSNFVFCQRIWDFKIIWNVYFFIVQYRLNNTLFYFFHWSFYKFILVIVYAIISYFIISTFQFFKFWILFWIRILIFFYPVSNSVKIHLNRVVSYSKPHWKIVIKFSHCIFRDLPKNTVLSPRASGDLNFLYKLYGEITFFALINFWNITLRTTVSFLFPGKRPNW